MTLGHVRRAFGGSPNASISFPKRIWGALVARSGRGASITVTLSAYACGYWPRKPPHACPPVLTVHATHLVFQAVTVGQQPIYAVLLP